MRWIAALRAADAPANLRTFADVVEKALELRGGDDRAEVIERGRHLIRPDTVCDIYELPINDLGDSLDGVADLDAHPSVLSFRHFTYRPGASEDEIRAAENEMDVIMPRRWADYLLRPVVLDTVHPAAGTYLDIYTPATAAGVTEAFYEWTPKCGAVMIAGTDGSTWLQLDTAVGDASPVVLLCSGDSQWEDTAVQAESIEAFIETAEAGQFDLDFDARRYQSIR